MPRAGREHCGRGRGWGWQTRGMVRGTLVWVWGHRSRQKGNCSSVTARQVRPWLGVMLLKGNGLKPASPRTVTQSRRRWAQVSYFFRLATTPAQCQGGIYLLSLREKQGSLGGGGSVFLALRSNSSPGAQCATKSCCKHLSHSGGRKQPALTRDCLHASWGICFSRRVTYKLYFKYKDMTWYLWHQRF